MLLQATINDTPVVERLERAAFRAQYHEPEKYIKRILTKSGFGWIYLQRYGGFTLPSYPASPWGAVGYVLGEFRSVKKAPVCQLFSIGILKSYRNEGIADELMNKFEESARKETEDMVLQVNVKNIAALRMYQKRGYVVDRYLPDFYSGGEHAHQMRLIR